MLTMATKPSSMFASFIVLLMIAVYNVECEEVCQDIIINCADFPTDTCTLSEVWAKANCAKYCGVCGDAMKKGCGPIDCGENKVMDKQTCQCIQTPCSAPCPQDSIRRDDCSCDCKNGRLFKNNDCVCPQMTCTSGQRMDDVSCKCVPEVCTTICPANTVLRPDCTCQGCAQKTCGDNQRMDNTTCECIKTSCTSTCPLESVRRDDGGCDCKNGRVFRDNDCVCPKMTCTSNQMINETSCECVPKICTQKCPANSAPRPDCTCEGCPVDIPNPNVVFLSTQGPIVAVGEYVSYECDKFKHYAKGLATRKCLPNEKLSGQPLECNDCPIGFLFLNNQCHGFMNEKTTTFSAARDVCKKVDGYLAMPKTKEENELVSGLGMGEVIRIGSSTREPFWDDEEVMNWNNWKSSIYPQGRCAVMDVDRLWVNVNCSDSYADSPIVCTIPVNKLCYNQKDKGLSYDGFVNYTHTDPVQTCLPWAKLTHCNHHPFRLRTDFHNLDENYCRNPDNSDRPWCYTTDKCSWIYCDVCGTKKRSDHSKRCARFKKEGYCTSKKTLALEKCFATCRDELKMEVPVVTKYTEVHCGPPQPPRDGIVVGNVRGFSKVGDTVKIRCKTAPWILFSRCLTSGQWSEVGAACLNDLCSDVFAKRCSKLLAQVPTMCKKYNRYAKRFCAKTCGFCSQ